MAYLIDADVLIEAEDRYYGFAFCPGFWDWLSQQKVVGTVLSVKAVGDEISAGKDQLSVWCAGHGPSMFVPPDAQTATAMATVSATVQALRVNNQARGIMWAPGDCRRSGSRSAYCVAWAQRDEATKLAS